ncbi:putative ribonuclease H-like domain-containing protein [Tanacetum coccineum]
MDLQDQGVIDSGCSRHMIGNMSYLTDYEEKDGGYVALVGEPQMRKITGKKNLLENKRKVISVMIIGLDFKNKNMNQFFEMDGILRHFRIARTPYKMELLREEYMTLIEAARTMLADSKLPTTFWAKAVNTACKFDGKADEGFFIGYSLNSKAFRVFNSITQIVEENLHIRFSDSTPNVVGSGPDWVFDIDALTRTMNYEPIVAGTQSNDFAGTKASANAGQARKKTNPVKDYILLPLWTANPPFSQDPKSSYDDGSKPSSDNGKKVDEDLRKDSECNDQEKEDNVNNTNFVNAAGTNEVNVVDGKTSIELSFNPNMPALEDVSIFDSSSDDEDDGAEADMNNLDTTIQVSPILTTRIHKDHPLDQVIGDLQSATQKEGCQRIWRNMGLLVLFNKEQTIKTFKTACLLAFYHRKNPKRNKKDEREIVIRNKARLVAQGYIQEEGIDYNEVFAPVARIEAIRLFLAYASFKDFMVYQMNVKSAFLYGKIEEEVYVCQLPGFEDPNFPNGVYKVKKVLYGLHQAPRAWHKGDILLIQVYVDDIIFGSTKKELCIAFEKLMHEKFQMSSIGELTFFLGLQVKQKKDGIFISQDKYVDEILKKFRFTEVKTTSTPMETQKPLLKDEDGEEVDVHMYRSMIGSLMYLTSSRPDIMFAVCACARYQVNPKVSHLHAVKRIFRYLKGQPKLGLWYPKDSLFDLVAYTDSDYAGASLDMKSTTGGCQFLGCRLISWQCKKQTVVANSTTEAEYVAASSCYGQVLWIQNQLLDYGYNFMHTKIFIDNNNCNEKKLIQMVKIHTDKNVADLLTKAFDFWSSVVAKTINEEVQLHALVDGKRTVITKTSVRRSLRLADAEGLAIPIDPQHTPTFIQSSTSQPQKTQTPRELTSMDTEIPQSSGPTKHVADEAVRKERGDSLVRAATTASSLEVE